MSKYYFSFIISFFLLSFTSAFSQKQTRAEKEKLQQEKIYHAVVDSQHFEFVPEYAVSMNGNRYITDFFVKYQKIKFVAIYLIMVIQMGQIILLTSARSILLQQIIHIQLKIVKRVDGILQLM